MAFKIVMNNVHVNKSFKTVLTNALYLDDEGLVSHLGMDHRVSECYLREFLYGHIRGAGVYSEYVMNEVLFRLSQRSK